MSFIAVSAYHLTSAVLFIFLGIQGVLGAVNAAGIWTGLFVVFCGLYHLFHNMPAGDWFGVAMALSAVVAGYYHLVKGVPVVIESPHWRYVRKKSEKKSHEK